MATPEIEIINYNQEKDSGTKINTLFITPFANGGQTLLPHMPNHRRIICSSDSTNKFVIQAIQKIRRIRYILFNNSCQITPESRSEADKKGIKICACEAGWFPHYTSWSFDPQGWLNQSLLAKSRLDDIQIDIEKTKQELAIYKKDRIKAFYKPFLDKTFLEQNKYVLVITQHTRDASIKYGYPSFTDWSDIIRFAELQREQGEYIIIKVHPLHNHSNMPLYVPNRSIVVEALGVNDQLMDHARLVIGVNSTMLAEASLLFNKPVIGLGNSHFDGHPEVISPVSISDGKIEQPIIGEKENLYRLKMFATLRRMQVWIKSPTYSSHIQQMIKISSNVKSISDWFIPQSTPSHLGGHQRKTWIDAESLNFLVSSLEIKTMVDVGCGPGGQVELARSMGIRSIGVEGDPSLYLPGDYYALHDYTTGTLPLGSFDLGWSVEFLEHVEEKYLDNIFSTFSGCSYIACTCAPPGKSGHHHVNCKSQEYWINVFKSYGFEFMAEMTEKLKEASSMKFMKANGMLFRKINV